MMGQIPTSEGQSASLATTSHDKPCCEAYDHLRIAERFAAYHTEVRFGGGACGCLVALEHHRSADHSCGQRAALMFVHAQIVGRTSNERRASFRN